MSGSSLINREITVIGAGVGGLAIALACARQGAMVTILEQAHTFDNIGAGLQISPNGWRVLSALGLATDISQRGQRAAKIRLRDFRNGANVFEFPLKHPNSPYHFMHRADLVDVFVAVLRSLNVHFRLNTRVSAIKPDGPRTHLMFSDGTKEIHGLTFAADGVNSVARETLNPNVDPFFTGQIAWRCTVKSQIPPRPEVQVFMGPGRHLVLYPLCNGELMNIVAVEERDKWVSEGWHHKDDPNALRRAFSDFCPEIRDILDKVESVFLWGLFQRPVAATWWADHVALLGDAAHPTLPFLAQGANMALEDAYVLTQCLAQQDYHDDVTAAFAHYTVLRRARTAQIVKTATYNAKNYHLTPGVYRFMAHTALRVASRTLPRLVTRRFDWIYDYDATQVINK